MNKFRTGPQQPGKNEGEISFQLRYLADVLAIYDVINTGICNVESVERLALVLSSTDGVPPLGWGMRVENEETPPTHMEKTSFPLSRGQILNANSPELLAHAIKTRRQRPIKER